MSEPKIRINGVLLTDGQAMTLRVACADFYSRIEREGLGDDEAGVQMAKAYIRQAASILSLMGRSNAEESNQDSTASPACYGIPGILS